ncbi:hypothetical protein L1889_03695 [Paenalcaligenes niemegkensis]|uniref:hypothetical protein n=1 Tax=Paenalcaligenes niemegkensis TaxID=2895469 RepID=UPI001EE7F081|nr:hypothetical protein [Paenalcaligenes niemegkensis]MCQ9615913.1 hypothetical protein [Paenalcaligenes niemegkensis]
MTKFYLHCRDEGHTTIFNDSERATDDNGKSALMVNPDATATTIIDAALVRAERIEQITAPFHFIDLGSLDDLPSNVIQDFLCAVNGMGHEVARLLIAAQSVAAIEKKGAKQ